MSDAGNTLNHHNNTSLIHLGGIIFYLQVIAVVLMFRIKLFTIVLSQKYFI